METLRNTRGSRARIALLLPVLIVGGMLAAWAQTYRDTPYGARFGMADGTATTTIDADGTVTAVAFVGDGSGLTGVAGGAATDSTFRIQDNGDNTKEIAFEASGITTSTTRTVTMPDSNVDLGDIATNSAKVTNATHTGDVTGSTALTIAAGAIDAPGMFSATGTADGTTFLRGDNTWSTPAGGGDMTLAGTQTVTGAKSFNDLTLILNGATSGTTTVKANATAGTTTATFQAASGTIAYTADIPADTDDLTEGGTNLYLTAAEETKLGYITITQAVNLDALESAVGGKYADDVFRIQDNSDATKQIAFQASGITTSTTRTITMPDADVDLGAFMAGAASSTDNALARFDGTSGTVVQNSVVTVADSTGNMAGVGTLNAHTIPGGADTFTLNAATQTLTNKRITKRSGTTTSSATPTINTDNLDRYSLTAQAVDITSFTTNLSGTPNEWDTLWIAITGTASRAISWGASFEDGAETLPTTTTNTDRIDVAFVWNSVTSKWRCMAVGP